MKYSAQEEFALRLLLAIAKEGPGAGLTIPELSQREGMSQPHVAKIMSLLRKSKFVKSTRGHIGGYLLAREPHEIVLGDVMSELGGRLYDAGFCYRHTGTQDCCNHINEDCSLRSLWNRIQTAVDAITYRLTLQDLIDGTCGDGGSVTFLSDPAARRAPAQA